MFWRKKDQPSGEEPAEEPTLAQTSEAPAAPVELPPEAPPEAAAAPAPRAGALWGPGVGPPPPEVAAAFDLGLARTRNALVGHLRGVFRGDQTDWDEVEESLIAADVGATLAMEVVERARAKRDDDPEAAVRRELQALLVEREPGWSPRPRHR